MTTPTSPAADAERILFIDPGSGVSGDMFLGALVSLGVPLQVITEAVDAVIPGEISLECLEVTRGKIAGTFCRVSVTGGPGRRNLDELLDLVDRGDLPPAVKTSAQAVLGAIGRAEAHVHSLGEGPVHLHELGGQDTLADIVGTLAGFHHLCVGRVVCGPVNLGSGTVRTDHGTLPVPAPATARLVMNMPVFASGPEMELTTPTGAALLGQLVDEFGPLPRMRLDKVGSGAGSRDNEGLPNLLRLFLGEGAAAGGESAVIIECGIDDVSPEYTAPIIDELHAAGAREVHLIPAHTKKGRVGILLRVLAPEDLTGSLIDRVLESSGSAGLRSWKVDRTVCQREMLTVDTGYGDVRIKRWRTPSGRWRAKPEFEDVRRVSERSGLPPETIRDLAMSRYLQETDDGYE